MDENQLRMLWKLLS